MQPNPIVKEGNCLHSDRTKTAWNLAKWNYNDSVGLIMSIYQSYNTIGNKCIAIEPFKGAFGYVYKYNNDELIFLLNRVNINQTLIFNNKQYNLDANAVALIDKNGNELYNTGVVNNINNLPTVRIYENINNKLNEIGKIEDNLIKLKKDKNELIKEKDERSSDDSESETILPSINHIKKNKKDIKNKNDIIMNNIRSKVIEKEEKKQNMSNNNMWKLKKVKDLNEIKNNFNETVLVLLNDENNKRHYLNESLKKFE
eukprot:514259_1